MIPCGFSCVVFKVYGLIPYIHADVFYNMLLFTDRTCADVDCYDHGRCEILYDGTPRCLCHHSRWSHDDTLTTNDADIGNCALETCDGGRICHNGGSCE